jgi:hypothetical protein
VTATDDVDGPVPVVCTPPSGTRFPLGITSVSCTAQDAAGNTATGGFTVTVRDTTPPSAPIAVALPIILFPANDKLVPVRVVAAADDRVDANPSCAITKITSNSHEQNAEVDVVQTGPLTALLRAERNTGPGPALRIYTLTVACTDRSGNVGRSSDAFVFVP